MIIKQNIKQLIRMPFTNILIITLLSLVSVFMFLSLSIRISAQRSIQNAQDFFTTIAVFNENTFRGAGYVSDEDYKNMYDTLTGIYDAADISGYIDTVDIRRPCMVYCEDISTVTSALYGIYDNYTYTNYPYNYSVIVGTVVSVEYGYGGSWVLQDGTGDSIKDMTFIGYTVIIEIDKNSSPLLINSYPYKYIRINSSNFSSDLNECLGAGDKCIVYGELSYLSITASDDKIPTLHFISESSIDHGRSSVFDRYEFVKIDEDVLNILGISSETEINRKNILDLYYRRLTNNDDLQYARIEGTVDDFLASEKGVKWNNIINECKVTTKSLMMRLTDNLDSILMFNQDLANII
ncbi:MAG: hypothetical protein WCY62_06195, partial [Clostridia bacterium]